MWRRVALPVIFLAATPAFGSALAWAPGPDAERTLVQGRPWAEVTSVEDGGGLIHAAIDIDAPPRTVWAVMNDCRLAARLVVTVTSCRTVQADPSHNWDVKEQVTRGSLFVPEIRNVVRSDYQPYSLIRFHRVGGNLKMEEGEWRLQALNGGAGTRVVYVNKVAVNILAPAPLVRAGMRKDTEKVMINLRRESLAALKAPQPGI